MMTLAFNPVTVGIGALSIIIIATAFVPLDAWDRFGSWLWRSDSEGSEPREMPWEKER